LHLPNDLAELIDTPARILKRAQIQHLDHEILLLPIQAFIPEVLQRWLRFTHPVLAVCPDDLLAEASEKSAALGFILPVEKFSVLSNESLRAHWKAMHSKLVPDVPYLAREPKLPHRLDLSVTDLPRAWLARQMGWEKGKEEPRLDQRSLVGEALYGQVMLSAIARLEQASTSPAVAEFQIGDAVEKEWQKVRVPVALALPGVASGYSRRVYTASERARVESMDSTDTRDTWPPHPETLSDVLIERSAIEFITTHRAIARSGIGFMMPSVPQEAFNVLGQLEEHCRVGAKGPQVWRLLDKLNTAMAPIWNNMTAGAVARASMLTAFTNFPIGLLRLPNDTEPLATRIPIAYRPILPLTNAVQRELMSMQVFEVPENFTVLVAECIPESDPVGQLSRRGWKGTGDFIKSTNANINLKRMDTLSKSALRAAIEEVKPDFLVISAHGFFDRESNMAGLVIGTELSLGTDIGTMPPVVILSACHVAPRGTSAVSVTDLLLRQDAIAVLGTQVPVDVIHNSVFMGRFFLYISETLAKHETHTNLLEVWHRTQTGNAVNDIANGSDSLRSWMMERFVATGRPVVQEFMISRSTGRLRNIYADTEQILGEIADEMGDGPKVRNWFRRPGYVPESLFYVFAGKPERIYLRPVADVLRQSMMDS
jgi:CHAT domain